MKDANKRKEISRFFYEEGLNVSSRARTTPSDEEIPMDNLIHTMNVGFEIDEKKHFIRASFRAKPKKWFQIIIDKSEIASWARVMGNLESGSFFTETKPKNKVTAEQAGLGI